MANLRNTTGAPAAARSGESVQEVRDRWAGEVSTGDRQMTRNAARLQEDPRYEAWPMAGPMMGGPGGMQPPSGVLQMGGEGQTVRSGGLNMSNLLPGEVVESPVTMNEAYLGSLKAMLHRNKGNYIVATFLVGTQNTVSWEGVLYEVGNDYLTIYQPGRDRYIVTDIYSLKYMEFYDTQRRELCDQMLRSSGWQSEEW